MALARLEREALPVASILHPNVALIHGMEEGASSIDLVVELVEGEALADRLSRGGRSAR